MRKNKENTGKVYKQSKVVTFNLPSKYVVERHLVLKANQFIAMTIMYSVRYNAKRLICKMAKKFIKGPRM